MANKTLIYMEISEIKYRQDVLLSDIDSVRNIVDSTGFFSDAEIAIAVELVEERLAKGIASGYNFLFADVPGMTIGYTCFGPIPGTAGSYDIYWIAVHKKFFRRGIGKRLMADTEEIIRNQGGVLLCIETSSRIQYSSTRFFYRNCGFREEATVKNFYGLKDDKIIYTKTLYS